MSKSKSYRMLIDGALVDAGDGARLESINPTTGEVWATFPAATAEDVDRAVRAAHRAMTGGPWAKLTATQRGKLIRRLGDLVAEHADAMAEVETSIPASCCGRLAARSNTSPSSITTTPAWPTRSKAPPCRSTSRTCS
jgi:hypothetical protein